MLTELTTPQGEALDPKEIPWQRYPRPRMRRDSYLNLNGPWQFHVSPNRELPREFERTIRLPFCPESRLSGIQEHFPEGSFLFYRREIALPENFNRGRVLLHIGAADQIADVYVNGRHLARHTGGYDSFSVDITEALLPTTVLIIRVRDDLRDLRFPRGKQTAKRGGMWYTPVSGIWQTVWLESVPETYIQKLQTEILGATVRITAQPKLDGTVTVEGLGQFPLKEGMVELTLKKPRFWCPEDPFLYRFSLEMGADRVESYFALRTLEIKDEGGVPRLCLNGRPYFFHGLLDQGYWPEGLLTPPSPDCYEEEILAMKALGFNTLRKHIKVEPQEFYYQCDKLGMVVFQDMVNNGRYHFLRDSALPMVGLQWLPDRLWSRKQAIRQGFLLGMRRTVEQLKSHPCVCYWTVFNEGWGQFHSTKVYRQLKKLDATRFIDTTSGWFRGHKTDVDSRHVYFRRVRLKAGKRPLVLSEFGGYCYNVAGHVFNTEETYGYGKFENQEAFSQAVAQLYKEQILPAYAKGLSAAIYTQVSDVEDETNGLRTYDRRVTKVDPETMQSVAEWFR